MIMKIRWLILTLGLGALILSSSYLEPTVAQSGNCLGGPSPVPTNIISAAPILKIGKFNNASQMNGSNKGVSPQVRRSGGGDASYTGGDSGTIATGGGCSQGASPLTPNVPRIAGQGSSAYPQITNAADMRFILYAEEPTTPNPANATWFESLTLKFYSTTCTNYGLTPFLTFDVPVNNCVLTNGYYVFSLTSEQTAALQPHLTSANNSPFSSPSYIYVGASITISRDEQTPVSQTGEIFYVGKAIPAPCGPFSVSSTEKTFESSGGRGRFDGTGNGCLWNVRSSQSWVSIDSEPFGNGNGTVRYTVSPHTTTGGTRTATITVGNGVNNQTYTITQTCNSLSPTNAVFNSSGGNGMVNVNPQGVGCSWLATESLSWLTITSGASGSSPGAIAYMVDPNDQPNSPARVGTLSISGFDFAVKQAGSGGDCATLPITT